ncbi:PadR family transcriptional regulator [Streptosporangium pseudovulgare]|uniref:PadR family transcriptional regulator n=2 Tax=Streptosporangium pseudovulgare TaxID=35765 RepID=A0ABQ2RDD2_9ACTN|nr:PadR family transcriptional regulator [Streptosporangium pseudovulgare]
MYYVLVALLDEPLHGHAILKAVAELSGRRVNPSVGTLYGILERLNDRGLIAVDREETVGGRSRRYFRLAEDGRGVLEAEARRMQRAASLVIDRLSPA